MINPVGVAASYAETNQAMSSGGAIKNLATQFASLFDRADETAQAFATQNIDAQSVVEALSEAELALQTAVTLRDRIVSAYQEVLRMPI